MATAGPGWLPPHDQRAAWVLEMMVLVTAATVSAYTLGCAPARVEQLPVPVRVLGDNRHLRSTEGVTRGSDGLVQAASGARVRTMCERTECPRVPALDGRLLDRQAKYPLCRYFREALLRTRTVDPLLTI